MRATTVSPGGGRHSGQSASAPSGRTPRGTRPRPGSRAMRHTSRVSRTGPRRWHRRRAGSRRRAPRSRPRPRVVQACVGVPGFREQRRAILLEQVELAVDELVEATAPRRSRDLPVELEVCGSGGVPGELLARVLGAALAPMRVHPRRRGAAGAPRTWTRRLREARPRPRRSGRRPHRARRCRRRSAGTPAPSTCSSAPETSTSAR